MCHISFHSLVTIEKGNFLLLISVQSCVFSLNSEARISNYTYTYLSIISFSAVESVGAGPPDPASLGTRLSSGKSEVKYTGTMVVFS